MPSSAIFDVTLNGLQNTQFCNRYKRLIKKLHEETHFSEVEVKCLLMAFHKIAMQSGDKSFKHVRKNQIDMIFVEVFQIYDMTIITRILDIFTNPADGNLGAAQWVRMVAAMVEEDMEKLMKYVFNIYDIGENEALSRRTVANFVDRMFPKEEEDEELQELKLDMVDQIFTKFDLDRDSNISFEEYCAVVRKDPNLLEFLGKCLPTGNAKKTLAICFNLPSLLKGQIKYG